MGRELAYVIGTKFAILAQAPQVVISAASTGRTSSYVRFTTVHPSRRRSSRLRRPPVAVGRRCALDANALYGAAARLSARRETWPLSIVAGGRSRYGDARTAVSTATSLQLSGRRISASMDALRWAVVGATIGRIVRRSAVCPQGLPQNTHARSCCWPTLALQMRDPVPAAPSPDRPPRVQLD